MADGDIERGCGLLERYHIARGHLGFDTCVVVTAKYASSAKLDASTLFPALRQVLQSHCALSVQVVRHEASSQLVFTRLPTVDLSRLVTFHTSEDLLPVVAKTALMTRIETGTTDPLWRLRVLPDNTAVFAFHHAIGDGKSGTAFHSSLLTALNQLSSNGENHNESPIVSIPGTLTLSPALEDATDISVSFAKLGRTVVEMFAPTSWTALSPAFTGNPVTTDNTFDIYIRLLTVPAEDAKKLLNVCRLHHATITSFLHTVGTLVLSTLIQRLSDTSYQTISTSVPLSMRPYTNVPEIAFCDHISAHTSYVDIRHGTMECTRPFPWDVASQFAVTLRQKAAASREQIGLLRYISGRYEDFFLGMQGKKRGETMELSNLGRFPSEDQSASAESRWHIEDMYFMQSNAICGAALKIMVVGSPSESIGISFNWIKGAVEDDFAESFVTEFGRTINEILGQEHS